MNKDTLNRLIYYRSIVLKMKEMGFKRIYSSNLADILEISPTKIRKDFSLFKIKGNYKAGYEINYLIKRFDEILNKSEIKKLIIVGIGNIGSALLNYKGFENIGVKIVAGFDINPDKINPQKKPPVLHLDEMQNFIRNNKIKIAILSVPEVAAQRVAEIMVEAGIKGILNFSPTKIKVKNCIVNNVHIEAELENLIYSVKIQS